MSGNGLAVDEGRTLNRESDKLVRSAARKKAAGVIGEAEIRRADIHDRPKHTLQSEAVAYRRMTD
jgi:hypothetical protein